MVNKIKIAIKNYSKKWGKKHSFKIHYRQGVITTCFVFFKYVNDYIYSLV